MLKQSVSPARSISTAPSKTSWRWLEDKDARKKCFLGISFVAGCGGQLCLAVARAKASVPFRKFPLREEISFSQLTYCRPECLELKETCTISRVVFP